MLSGTSSTSDLGWLLGIVSAVFVLAVVADIALLTRWLIYQVRLRQHQRWESQGGLVSAGAPSFDPVAYEPIGFDFGPTAEPGFEEAPPAPRAPFAARWSFVDLFLGFQLILIGAAIVEAIPIVLAMLVASLADPHHDPLSAMRSPIVHTVTQVAIIGALLFQNLLFVLVAGYLLCKYGTSLRRVGLRLPPRRAHVLIGLAFGLLLLAASALLEQIVGAGARLLLPHHTLASLQKASAMVDAGRLLLTIRSPWLRALFILGGAVAAPIGEEAFFRGLIYNTLKNRYSVAVATVGSALLFALVHASPLGIFVIFPMGLLLAYVYEKTRSLWVTIAMHCVNNSAAFLFLLLSHPPHGR